MSLIRAGGNRDTELRLISVLRGAQITGWRRKARLFGKPDFVFPKQRAAVFVDGCFWHRHPGCKFCYTPKSRTEFWLPKFQRNMVRDRLVTRTLRKAGWRVVRIWECDLVRNRQARVITKLRLALLNATRLKRRAGTTADVKVRVCGTQTPARRRHALPRSTVRARRCASRTRAIEDQRRPSRLRSERNRSCGMVGSSRRSPTTARSSKSSRSFS